MSRPFFIALIASCAVFVSCSDKNISTEVAQQNLDLAGVMKSTSRLCDGAVLSENRIPCQVAESKYKGVKPETAYRCLIVVHANAVRNRSSSLRSLKRDGALAWGRIADLKYGAIKSELTEIQQDFIVKDAENPMNLRRWSEDCSKQYFLAEQQLREIAFSGGEN